MNLLGWALPVGLATGLAAWMFAGGASANFDKLDSVEAQLLRFQAPVVRRMGGDFSPTELITTPLFALTTGPGAIREPSIKLDGISLAGRRAAALVSIDGKSATWLTAGETAEGVTLQGVTSSGASFETALGTKTLSLGEQSAASAPDPHASTPPPGPTQAATADRLPPGVRGPPEPASAAPRR